MPVHSLLLLPSSATSSAPSWHDPIIAEPATCAADRSGPWPDESFDVDLRDERPPGSFPPIAGAGLSPLRTNDRLIKDLDRVVFHFQKRSRHVGGTGGTGAFLSAYADELSHALKQDPNMSARLARLVLTAARQLAQCLDARETWGPIHLRLQEDARHWRAAVPVLRERLDRIEAMSAAVDREWSLVDVNPRSPGALTPERLDTLCQWMAAWSDRTESMRAAADNLSSLGKIWRHRRTSFMLRVLSEYEDIVARACLFRDAAEVDPQIARYDRLSPELLLADHRRALGDMNTALLGRRRRQGSAGTALARLPPCKPGRPVSRSSTPT